MIRMTSGFVEGQVRLTAEAGKEGILAAGWYTREQLDHGVVFPALLGTPEWKELQTGPPRQHVFPTERPG